MARSRVAEEARYWVPDALSGCGLLKAQFRTHRFARHTHAEYGIGLVESGGHRLAVRGVELVASPRSFVVLNPGEAHDGRSAVEDGYTFRVFYIEPTLMRAALACEPGRTIRDPVFPQAVIEDPELAGAFAAVHRLCDPANGPAAAIEAQTGLIAALATLARRHGEFPLTAIPAACDDARMRRAQAWLADNLDRNVGLDELAAEIGLSPFHAARLFKSATGLAPHAWLNQVRIDRARGLLRDGVPPANVAAAVGFFDQAHLNRRFLAHTGVTPGHYAAAFRARHSKIVQYGHGFRPIA